MAGEAWEKQLALRERPRLPWVMRQRWEDLLFLHWEWEPADVQRRLPEGLEVATWGGRAYLGLVPFFMRGVRPRFLPAVVGLSDFLELNLRTYVTDASGRPGVWFFSLDCDQPVAVWAARTFFHLPYRHAEMSAKKSPSSGWCYRSRRKDTREGVALNYRLKSGNTLARPGSLDFFLIERYLLFSLEGRSGRIRGGRVWHAPYRLVPVEFDGNWGAAFAAEGFRAPEHPPDHVVASPGVDVWIHPLEG